MWETTFEVGYLLQLFIVPGLLFLWGRRVALRHGDARRWRIASRVPLATWAVNALVPITAIAWLLASFVPLANMDAADRATALARSIAGALNAAAFVAAVSFAVYVACAIGFAYGTLAPPRSAPLDR